MPSVRSLSRARQAKTLGVARFGPGSLLRRGSRVLVEVRFDHGAAAAAGTLRARGARIVNVSRRYQTVTAAVKPAALRRVAAVRRVSAVNEVLAPLSFATCPSGEIVSEGDAQLKADKAREGPPKIDGSGVTVGILSDSFNQATKAADGSGNIETHEAQDVESADLPGTENLCGNTTPVNVLSEFEPKVNLTEEPFDEGRAMAQIVHDLAPGADLEFASAFNGPTAFAESIRELAESAGVLADDVVYFEEPIFQDGPIAVAAAEAVVAGATYLSAAGNDNLLDPEGHEIASWEAPEYRDSGGCPQEVAALPGFNATHCLDFNPGSQTDRTFGIKVEPGALLSVDMQWDEPWHGVGTDLDGFLLNASGNLITGSAEENIDFSQKPTEIVQWENESSTERTVQFVVNRFAGGSPRLKFIMLQNGSGVAATEYPRSTGEDVVGPTIFGHSGAAAAISVGAVRFDAPEPSLEPEEYSSLGPVRHDFGPVSPGTEAAPPLGSPEILSKPDVEATDCGKTTFFASFVSGAWRFCGTSAAAPHAAAVAALMLERKSTATPAEIGAALRSSAVPGTDPCAVGSGLVEAVGAIEDLLKPPSFTPPVCSTPESEEPSGENARAAGDWGLENPPPTENSVPPPPPPPIISLAPSTSFRQKPAKVVRTRRRTAKVVFRFRSDQADVSFECKLDSGKFHGCPQRLVLRSSVGKHVVRVRAVSAVGIPDATPVVYRFRVKRMPPA